MILPAYFVLLIGFFCGLSPSYAITSRSGVQSNRASNIDYDFNGATEQNPSNKTLWSNHSKPETYEICGVYGEPNYRSVNLTWIVQLMPEDQFRGRIATEIPMTNSTAEQPYTFEVFYCELQAFGPYRCRVKLVDGNDEQSVEAVKEEAQLRHFNVQIDNLRMATTYSFHIRPRRGGLIKPITGRSEIFDNQVDFEVGESNANSDNGSIAKNNGQTIIVPTKGFSAEAAKCLPHASEIEVETGPYFGGKIVVDGSNCGVKGNPDDPVEKYTMRIDHKACGSLIKPETNTVETFITVQENLDIYTHSTRRFVVVCSFSSGMQTVRASFTVPGKNGVTASVENDPFIMDDRSGRKQSVMHYVDKSALVLISKGDAEAVEKAEPKKISGVIALESTPSIITTSFNNLTDTDFSKADTGPIAQTQDIFLHDIKHENIVMKNLSRQTDGYDDPILGFTYAGPTNYAKLVDNREELKKGIDAFDSALHFFNAHMDSLVVSASMLVIIIVLCIIIFNWMRHYRPKRCLPKTWQSCEFV